MLLQMVVFLLQLLYVTLKSVCHFDVFLKFGCHGLCLLMSSDKLCILLVVMEVLLADFIILCSELFVFFIVEFVLFVDSFVLDSEFFVLIIKDIVLTLELMELGLHVGLFFDGHAFGLGLGGTVDVALALEIGVVLGEGFVLL